MKKIKTYYPEYESLNYSLWKLHLEHKKKNSSFSGIKTYMLEMISFLGMEKSGYFETDYIIAGDDPLISLISALEKVTVGKKVVIYPSQMIEDDNSKIFGLINQRTSFISKSLSDYINEKYSLNPKKKDLSISELIILLSEKISEYKDSKGDPLCYLYKGRELYSDAGKGENYKGNQIYWPREKELIFGEKWKGIYLTMDRISLVSKEKKNKDVKGFILAEQAILTSRTHSSFCSNYIVEPIKIADAFYQMETGKTFGLQHRLADFVSAMSINDFNDKSLNKKIKKMYEVDDVR